MLAELAKKKSVIPIYFAIVDSSVTVPNFVIPIIVFNCHFYTRDSNLLLNLWKTDYYSLVAMTEIY